MRHACVLVVLAALLRPPAACAWFSDPDRSFGDLFQILNPAAGLAMAIHRDDSEGERQWLYSMATTEASVLALKAATRNTTWDTRPDGTPGSFPSGHTAMACAGAGFLWNRYGAPYGAPAYALAAYTGWSRVDHDKHHWRDVVVGCGLSIGVNRLFVTRQADVSVTVQPRGAELAIRFAWR